MCKLKLVKFFGGFPNYLGVTSFQDKYLIFPNRKRQIPQTWLLWTTKSNFKTWHFWNQMHLKLVMFNPAQIHGVPLDRHHHIRCIGHVSPLSFNLGLLLLPSDTNVLGSGSMCWNNVQGLTMVQWTFGVNLKKIRWRLWEFSTQKQKWNWSPSGQKKAPKVPKIIWHPDLCPNNAWHEFEKDT